MKLIAYLRTSTEEQLLGLESQRDRLETYARLFGYKVVHWVVENVSARSVKRNGLQHALALLRDGCGQGLLILCLDRLTRDVESGSGLIREWFSEGSKYKLISVQDHIDTTTAIGRYMLTIKLGAAQYEREANAERTKAALAVKRRNGERCGGVLYGFDATPSGKLRKNAKEQRALSLMRRLRKAGWSYARIAAELGRRGFKPKNGGAKWESSSVRAILKRHASAR